MWLRGNTSGNIWPASRTVIMTIVRPERLEAGICDLDAVSQP